NQRPRGRLVVDRRVYIVSLTAAVWGCLRFAKRNTIPSPRFGERGPGLSADDFLDDLGGRVGDADRPADVGLVLLGRVDADGGHDGRQEVGHRDGPLLDSFAALARLADRLPALDAAADHDGGPCVGVVIAALL